MFLLLLHLLLILIGYNEIHEVELFCFFLRFGIISLIQLRWIQSSPMKSEIRAARAILLFAFFLVYLHLRCILGL